MKVLILGLAMCGLAGGAIAQEGAAFKNPSPVNFDQPFLYDAVKARVRAAPSDSAMSLEVIDFGAIAETPRLAPPVPIEEFLRKHPRLTAPSGNEGTTGERTMPEAKEPTPR